MTKRWNTLRIAGYGAAIGVVYALVSDLPKSDPSGWQMTADFWPWLAEVESGEVQIGRFELVQIEALIVAPGNPRSHPPKQIQALLRCVKSLGFNQPLAVDAHKPVDLDQKPKG